MDLLDSRHAENNMPKFLNQPTDAIIVRHIGSRNPLKNANIITPRTFLNSVPSHGKLCAALVPDISWYFAGVDSKEIAQNVRQLVDHVLIVVVD